MGKRTFDVLFALVAFLFLWPLMLLTALAVKLESPGPVLFRQERVGRHGRHFMINKFRSMRVGGRGPNVTSVHDARITRVGRIIRATKLDELPQLWNVIAGHMSVVGPRPEVPVFVANWPERSRSIILSVRPGITCLASVRFRHEAEIIPPGEQIEEYYFNVLMPAKNALSEAYVLRGSPWLDVKIILATGRALFEPARRHHAIVACGVTESSSDRASDGAGARPPRAASDWISELSRPA